MQRVCGAEFADFGHGKGFSICLAQMPAIGDFPPPNIHLFSYGWLQVLKGKDPEGANVLLQCLAKAADVLQMDGADAVAVRLSRKQICCIKPVHGAAHACLFRAGSGGDHGSSQSSVPYGMARIVAATSVLSCTCA